MVPNESSARGVLERVAECFVDFLLQTLEFGIAWFLALGPLQHAHVTRTKQIAIVQTSQLAGIPLDAVLFSWTFGHPFQHDHQSLSLHSILAFS